MTDRVAGVDGARIGKTRGWLVVELDGGRFHSARFLETFGEVLAAVPAAAVVGVDVPIGLVPSGGRDADEAARRFLGRRASSVFRIPPRPVLDAEGYAEACERSRATMGKAISKQAWAILSAIRQVDPWKEDRRIHEVHPEVSFQMMAGKPLELGKKTWGGHHQRRRLLAEAGIEIPELLEGLERVAPDDVLDAAVAAWSAARVAAKTARSFPDRPLQRGGSRVIAVWA